MDESGSRDRALGDLLVEQGLAGRGQIDECLSLLAKLREGGAAPVPTLGSLLLQKGYLSSSGYERTLRLSGSPSTSSPVEVPPDVRAAMADPGRHAGKFVMLSLLGRGGMGEVWKAWDRDLGRFVALKLVLGQDPGEEQRLRIEAMTAGGLAHPHIAPVYETGTHEGRTFIAMQLVQGTTLAKADLALRPLLEVIRDAARALEFAHRNGVVHRDVKPDNLMVAGRHVYVMDFGLARQAARGAIVGTPAFMSPEQARGEADRLDGRSDVCSLGATLYALLSGRPPREGLDLSEILRKAASEEPVPPRRHRPSIPGEVEAIILKAMEVDPSRRYASAQEMADDLQRFLDGEPIRARKATVGYRLRKFVLRKKAAVAVAAAGAVAVAILVPRWLSERSGRERERVEHAEREAALKELGALWGLVAIEKLGLHHPGNDPQKVLERIRGAVDRVDDFTRRHPAYPQGWYVRGMGRLHLDDLAGAEEDLREALRRNGAFTPAHTLLARVLIERHTRGVTTLEREAEQRGREAEGFLTAAREHLAKAG
ncbi:MAG TPA: serine/threonine-protein kinase, partial [Planctomycetota bacterium]|nr:serine/threonine-protein kinase [Planctomycetota bacterium]